MGYATAIAGEITAEEVAAAGSRYRGSDDELKTLQSVVVNTMLMPYNQFCEYAAILAFVPFPSIEVAEVRRRCRLLLPMSEYYEEETFKVDTSVGDEDEIEARGRRRRQRDGRGRCAYTMRVHMSLMYLICTHVYYLTLASSIPI
jgi:hypothetical protein